MGQPVRIADYIRYWAAADPSSIAIRTPQAAISWQALDRRSDELAAGLRLAGLAPGDRLCALLNSRIEYIELTAACLKAGIIICPLNIALTPHELSHQIMDSGARAIVTESAAAAGLHHVIGKIGGVRIWCIDGDAGPRFDDLYDINARAQVRRASPDDGSFLCYTSGTTGTPKAALLTEKSVQGAGRAILMADGITHDDRILALAPTYVTGSIVCNLTQYTFMGGATYLMGIGTDPEQILPFIINEGVTGTAMVPYFYQLISEAPQFAANDLSTLRHCTTGGPDLTEQLIDTYRARGVSLNTAFGQTEMSGAICWANRRWMGDRLRAVGRPLPSVNLRIVDEEDRDVAPGESGEILVQGAGLMREYWNRPEATEEDFRGGWHHTGDVGSLDDGGYVYIHDRKKDMIRSGGVNVFPAEIEQALQGAFPVSSEIAVIGVPDDKWGEVGMLVVANDQPVDLPQVQSILAERLARYKHPYHLVVMAGPLPRNASGKVRKVDLRQRYPTVPADAQALRGRRGD